MTFIFDYQCWINFREECNITVFRNCISAMGKCQNDIMQRKNKAKDMWILINYVSIFGFCSIESIKRWDCLLSFRQHEFMGKSCMCTLNDQRYGWRMGAFCIHLRLLLLSYSYVYIYIWASSISSFFLVADLLLIQMNTSDRSMEYDQSFVKQTKQRKNHLMNRVKKFQEIVNQIGAPPSANQVE